VPDTESVTESARRVIEPRTLGRPVGRLDQSGPTVFDVFRDGVVAQIGGQVRVGTGAYGVREVAVPGPTRDGDRPDETVRVARGADTGG
jgi:hypothetical protein